MHAPTSSPATSKLQLSAYVNFQGRAREALEFYHSVLGGTLDLHTVDAQGVAGPAGPGDRITHARLEADGALILGSDGHPDYPPTVGDHLALALGGPDRARLTTIFDHLAAGGYVKLPLTPQPSGAEVGWLTDQFGLSWMVTVDPS